MTHGILCSPISLRKQALSMQEINMHVPLEPLVTIIIIDKRACHLASTISFVIKPINAKVLAHFSGSLVHLVTKARNF